MKILQLLRVVVLLTDVCWRPLSAQYDDPNESTKNQDVGSIKQTAEREKTTDKVKVHPDNPKMKHLVHPSTVTPQAHILHPTIKPHNYHWVFQGNEWWGSADDYEILESISFENCKGWCTKKFKG